MPQTESLSPKKLGIGIIGLGMASAPHARALLDLKDRADVVAAYSPTAARREAFAKSYGLPVAEDLGAILSDPAVDAVFILTPPNSHLDLVERAAGAGKHILLEKPLEITPDRARRLVACAQSAGVKLGVVFQNRFRPAALVLRELVDAGRLGDIVSASLRLYNWRPQSYYDQPGRGTLARDGGGVLLTQAIHTIDLMISLAGLPREIFGRVATTSLHRMETEDLAAGTLVFENGAIGTISATTCAYPGFADRVEIIGTLGTAILEGETMRAGFLDGTTAEAGKAGDGTGACADPMAFGHAPHRALIGGFLDAVREDTQPVPSGLDALKAHVLIDALLRSSASGRPQSVSL